MTRRTARLDLTPVAMSDAASLRRVSCDADVRRYLLDGQAVSAEWVEAEILASQRRWLDGTHDEPVPHDGKERRHDSR